MALEAYHEYACIITLSMDQACTWLQFCLAKTLK
jgi:hypothetical protein